MHVLCGYEGVVCARVCGGGVRWARGFDSKELCIRAQTQKAQSCQNIITIHTTVHSSSQR